MHPDLTPADLQRRREAGYTALFEDRLKINPSIGSERDFGDLVFEGLMGIGVADKVQFASSFARSTGFVPTSVVNDLMRDVASTDPAEVSSALVRARHFNEAAKGGLAATPRGRALSERADAYHILVNDFEMPPRNAARWIMNGVAMTGPGGSLDRDAVERQRKVDQEYEQELKEDDENSLPADAAELADKDGAVPIRYLGDLVERAASRDAPDVQSALSEILEHRDDLTPGLATTDSGRALLALSGLYRCPEQRA